MLFGNGMETMQMLKGGKRKNREQLQTLKYRLPGGKTKKKQERHHLHPKIRECRGQNILLLYLKNNHPKAKTASIICISFSNQIHTHRSPVFSFSLQLATYRHGGID